MNNGIIRNILLNIDMLVTSFSANVYSYPHPCVATLESAEIPVTKDESVVHTIGIHLQT